jgi:translation initiation factor 3 subunit M
MCCCWDGDSATNVFNKATALPALRFDALVAIIDFAGASGNVALVDGYFDGAEQLLGASLSPAQRRALFLTIANVIEKDDASSLKVLVFLEKYLATFAGVTDAKELATGKDVAVRAAKLALKQPVASFLARVDLLANAVVAATLKPCKTNGKLFELLEIVSTKTLVEFTAFQKANTAVFGANGLDEAELATAMRLFTLAALPTGFDEIPYAAVAKTLAVPEDDVEQWVVRAITANVVTAKIDQLRRTVVVSRALQRGFGAAQWAEVDAKLQQYKSNVGALLQIIRNARQAQAAQ